MTEFVEVKTSEMAGVVLNWATFCAVYTGMQPTIRITESTTKQLFKGAKPTTFPRVVILSYVGAYGIDCDWYPSSDWDCCGPLIDKYALTLTPYSMEFNGPPHYWTADPWDERALPADGPTALIAACRAIVASALGDTVSVPAELVKP
jgi:hypothetical protein